jgi:AraC-like DNA-binding protein
MLYFDDNTRRMVTEANINYYALPFIHPERTMSEHDFIYVLEGEWKIGQNDEVFTLKKDSLLILSAENRHFGAAPCQAETKTMYFHLTKNAGDRLDCENGINILSETADNKNVKRIFRDIVEAKLAANDKKASILVDLLLCELALQNKNGEQHPIVDKIKNIIHRSPEKFFSNTEFAEKLGVSVKTAENKFKAVCGVTIHQYILNFKIEQSISYFKNFPEMQIKEVAYNLGFYDEYHFSKQFKKITGLSPAAYRKNMIK